MKLFKNFIFSILYKFKSEYRYEGYAAIVLLLGFISSIVAGICSDDWTRFPATISTLNSNILEPSGRIFFATLLISGICLIKSDHKGQTTFLSYINSLGFICILGIALFPTASVMNVSKTNKQILLFLHFLFVSILFCIIPIVKLIKIIVELKMKKKNASKHQKIRLGILSFSILLMIIFFILMYIIFQNGTEDRLKDPNTEPLTGSDFWVPTHIASFTIEIVCALFAFTDILLILDGLKEDLEKDEKIEKEISTNTNEPETPV
ncbi:hypothetical protein CYY_006324 [Polysphondylium violaceum]|uniref:Uncharacterized protein n=1 Tax=Polysphondylium violaceum TaxID=133409 RepID=A0A8J4PSC5_9MYCE|nr:hypothetical protein CYY_006324 [Polysphondylium violaceum]